MHQLIQSAIDAAHQGDKNKAMGFIKEVLSANPNAVDAWLVLAAIVDEPQRKRQCLNRVLTLDPANQIAREELLDMDRASMGGIPPFIPEPAPDSQPKQQLEQSLLSYSSGNSASQPAPTPTQATHVSLKEWPQDAPQAAPQPKSTSKSRSTKPPVFKYSIVTRIATYFFAALFTCLGLFALLMSQDLTAMIVPCGLVLFLVPVIWIISAEVEVSGKGIRTSRMFGLTGSQVGWDEIARVKSNSMQRNLELITKKGNTVKVTSQVSGYPAIVETLRQKRPDLFGMAPFSSMQNHAFASEHGNSPSTGYGASTAAPAFSGTKTFKKSFFKQYGLYIIVIPFCLFAVWVAFTDPENRLGAGLAAAFCAIFIILPLFQISSVKVEPNKLTIESLFKEQEFSARQIREIKMQSVRGRYGRVTNFINIILAEGKQYPIQGFSEGDEIIYGFLMNWWNTYRNR